jgi:hypothetical protein
MNHCKTQGLLLSLVLVLVWAPAAPAQAETIAQLRELAAQGWHQTYEAHGRTVAVDIPVQVPDADQYPVLQAAYMPPLDTPPVSDWADVTLFQDTGFFRLDSHSPQNMQKAGQANRNDPPHSMDVQPFYVEINQLEPDTAYAYDNPGTVRDAQAMLEAVWADNFPNQSSSFSPYAVYATGAMRSYDAVADVFSGDPWPYQGVMMVYFHQVIGGIPLLCRGESCFGSFDPAAVQSQDKRIKAPQTIPVGATAILQKMPDGSGMFYSAQYYPLAITKTLLADLPLCGLDEVLHTCEQLITQGMLRQVSSLRLGYAAWQAEDGSFTLTPAWVLTGNLYTGPDTPDRAVRGNVDPRIPEHGTIIVSALTAELIDPARIDLNSLYP